jgi:hypothetical protein
MPSISLNIFNSDVDPIRVHSKSPKIRSIKFNEAKRLGFKVFDEFGERRRLFYFRGAVVPPWPRATHRVVNVLPAGSAADFDARKRERIEANAPNDEDVGHSSSLQM